MWGGRKEINTSQQSVSWPGVDITSCRWWSTNGISLGSSQLECIPGGWPFPLTWQRSKPGWWRISTRAPSVCRWRESWILGHYPLNSKAVQIASDSALPPPSWAPLPPPATPLPIPLRPHQQFHGRGQRQPSTEQGPQPSSDIRATACAGGVWGSKHSLTSHGAAFIWCPPNTFSL